MVNLISNSIKFTEDGKINITAYARSSKSESSRVELIIEVEETKEKEHLQPINPTEMIFPLLDELQRLIHAAGSGGVTDLKNCIADIKLMGLQYQPFVDKIEAWGHAYKFNKIVEFLENHVGKHDATQ